MNDLNRQEVIVKLQEFELLANRLVTEHSETLARTLAGEIQTYLEKIKGIKYPRA